MPNLILLRVGAKLFWLKPFAGCQQLGGLFSLMHNAERKLRIGRNDHRTKREKI